MFTYRDVNLPTEVFFPSFTGCIDDKNDIFFNTSLATSWQNMQSFTDESTRFFIRKWFISEYLFTALSCSKIEKVQYRIFETLDTFLVFIYSKFDFSVYKISYM